MLSSKISTLSLPLSVSLSLSVLACCSVWWQNKCSPLIRKYELKIWSGVGTICCWRLGTERGRSIEASLLSLSHISALWLQHLFACSHKDRLSLLYSCSTLGFSLICGVKPSAMILSFIFCALTPPTVPMEHHIQDLQSSQAQQYKHVCRGLF